MAGTARTTRWAGMLAIILTVPFIGNAVENLALLQGDPVEAGAHEGSALIGIPLPIALPNVARSGVTP